MSNKKKTKLCGSCDGMVDLDVIICPYCGSDVLEILEDREELEVEEHWDETALSPFITYTKSGRNYTEEESPRCGFSRFFQDFF